MRHPIILLLVVAGLLGCEQRPDGATTRGITVADAEAVSKELRTRPNWLFPADECPADVWVGIKPDIHHIYDECRQNLPGCLRRCEAEDAEACYALARIVETEMSDKAADQALFLRACRLGIPSGCTNRAAGMSNRPASTPEEDACGARSFELTCGLDDPWGCAMYGRYLAESKGVSQNLELALKYLRRSCELDEDYVACKHAKALIRDIEAGRVPPSP